MKSFREFAVLTILGSAFLSSPRAALAADLPALLTAQETKAVNDVISATVAAGFPDAQKAEVYSGKLRVKATIDPAKDPPPLPSESSSMQSTIPGSTRVTYGYEFDGLHFKLADGSWIINCQLRFKPKGDDEVLTKAAMKVAVETLTADAAKAKPIDVDKVGAQWLEKVAPAQRDRTRATMARLVPALTYLGLDPDSTAPATVLLARAGWTDAPSMSLVIADTRSRTYWQLAPWKAADVEFDPTGRFTKLQEQEGAWRNAQTTFSGEAPDVALRRALFRWCRGQLMVESPEDTMLAIPVAAAAAKACVDPKDPQKNAAKIDALAAGMKLPISTKADASLVERLQSWEARSRQPRMTVTGNNGGGGASISTSFAAPVSAYSPEKTDLDALIALLADERPSRFSDFSGARTVGDNAWRAVATLLNDDPRTLAKYPTDHPWTAAERKAAATAVQAWWKAHGKEFLQAEKPGK